MHCRNCNKDLEDFAVACTSCGANPKAGTNFCPNCGAATQPAAIVCLSCGGGLNRAPQPMSELTNKKMIAGLCGILLGSLGVHKFILGYKKAGIIMAAISVGSLGFAAPLVHLVGLVEGIIYLTKSDADFYQTYVAQVKEWF